MSKPEQKVDSKFDRLEAKIDEIILRLPAQVETSGLVHRMAEKIERFPFTRLLAAMGIWLILATGIGIYWEYNSRSEERIARKQEAEFRRLSQISLAWENLTQRFPGNSGKGQSINLLVSEFSPSVLSGLNLSCRQIGVYSEGSCDYRAEVAGVRNERPDCGGFGCDWSSSRTIEKVNFAETNLTGWRLSFVRFRGILLSGSRWQSSHLDGVWFERTDFGEDGYFCRFCKLANVSASAELLKHGADSFVISGSYWISSDGSKNRPTEDAIAEFRSEAYEGSLGEGYLLFAHSPPIFWHSGRDPDYAGRPYEIDAVSWEYYENFTYCVPNHTDWATSEFANDWTILKARTPASSLLSDQIYFYSSNAELIGFEGNQDFLFELGDDFSFLTDSGYEYLRDLPIVCGIEFDAVRDIVEANVRAKF